jgi:hypothetical protein
MDYSTLTLLAQMRPATTSALALPLASHLSLGVPPRWADMR